LTHIRHVVLVIEIVVGIGVLAFGFLYLKLQKAAGPVRFPKVKPWGNG
jgi:hypothetical protein